MPRQTRGMFCVRKIDPPKVRHRTDSSERRKRWIATSGRDGKNKCGSAAQKIFKSPE